MITVPAPDPVPLWFGPEDRPLFGWLHLPGASEARGAVVLCPPLFREHLSAHPTYRLVAEGLAARGLAALRFDYDGTGDAVGGDHDPDRVPLWIASIGHAVALVRATGAPEVALAGMRMGALLAGAALADLADVTTAVFWDPCDSARAFLREQTTLQRMQFGPPVDEGVTDVPGFELRADDAYALTKLTLGPRPDHAVHALLLTRPERRPARAFLDFLGSGQLEQGVAQGQEAMLEVEPMVGRPPHATIDLVVGWLAEHMEAQAVPCQPPVTTSGAQGLPSEQVTFRGPTGGAIHEQVVRVGPVPMFGILTTPSGDGRRESSGPTVVALNTGNDWHAGSNRLWVDLARRWAERGVRTVRIDLSGLGDSPGRAGQARDVVWAPQAFDDVRELVQEATADTGTPGVVLAGLCSGAYLALECALRWPVSGVMAVNPVLRFLPPELSEGPIDPRRRVVRPTTPLVSSYRMLPFRRVRAWLRPLLWWLANVHSPGDSPARWMPDLVETGADLLIVCGDDESQPFLHGSRRVVDRLRRSGRFHFEVVEGLDHALLPADDRDRVGQILTDRLFDLAPTGGRPSDRWAESLDGVAP